jgi:hypothetical protein
MSMLMKRLSIAMLVFVACCSLGGCKAQASDNDAIRAGILRHLTAVGTLNINAMDMDIRSVSINGDQAHAEVEFRPKTGGVPGAGMQVAYNLEKRDGTWTVLKTQAAGGAIQHPDPSQNPHQNQNVHSGTLPDFNSVLNPAGAPASGALPPRHPPVATPQSNPQPAGQDTSSARKPR